MSDENNWVHISIKSKGGDILDARAEDGDVLKAIVDGTLGAGYFDGVAARFGEPGDATAAAVANLQNGGLTSEGSGINKPAPTAGTGGDSEKPWDLGPDPLSGDTITVFPTGKFGPFVKCGEKPNTVFANVPKGVNLSTITVQMAAQWIAKKRG